MSLSASVLSADMRALMLAESDIGAIDGPALTALCDAIASAVVAHVTAYAVASPINKVDPQYSLAVSGVDGFSIVGEGSIL